MAEVETDDALALLMGLRHVSSSQENLMAEDETDDQFAFMMELCHISSSQEEILRHCLLVGETVRETAQDAGKGSQDSFHSPPEQQSSLPSSSDKQKSVEFHHCAINNMVEFDEQIHGFVDSTQYAEVAEFVDLSDDSDLGFLQVKLGKAAEFVDLSDDSELGSPPLKKLKHAEQNPGFEFSQADFQPQQNVQIGKEMYFGRKNALGGSPVEKNLGSQSEIARNAEKIKLHDIEECDENSKSREGNLEAEIFRCPGELNKLMNEVAETSERHKRVDKQPESPLLLPSVLEALQNAAKGEKENGKVNCAILEALIQRRQRVKFSYAS